MDNLEQRTDEWFNLRLGKVTASRVKDVISRTKLGYSKARDNYMLELICERLTNEKTESLSNKAMARGVELEDLAREIYLLNQFDSEVKEVGFVPHPTIKNAGASPDGLVNDDGLIEIKCPNTTTHINLLETNQPKKEYIYQMMWQMACTGRKWCDFVSYDDRLPDNLSYKCIRINYDEELVSQIEKEVIELLAELESRLSQINERNWG